MAALKDMLFSTAGSGYSPEMLKLVLLAVLGLAVVALVLTVIITVYFIKTKKSFLKVVLLLAAYAGFFIVLAAAAFCFIRWNITTSAQAQLPPPTTAPTTAPTEPETEPVTEPEPEPTPGELFAPKNVDSTDPEKMGIKWEIMVDGELVENYQREEKIQFPDTKTYTDAVGITTFRGNNYRNTASYGTATVAEKTITKTWDRGIGSLNDWPGSGWTGQPLMVRWDAETKQIMNLYQEKKDKEDLVEVILATLDGYVYFYDLDDGSYTRDPLFLGMNFKGAGSLDPRGYPIMYVGSGDNYNGAPKMYIVSLIDTTVLYEQSGSDNFAYRGWYAFDSAPLVHGDSDTLIWPGESGILYTMDLNTEYDKTAGTISVSPDHIVKARYNTESGRSLGMESSCLIVENYLYMADNGGYFFCVDLNTMAPVWVQDTKDDVNATPVFEWGEDGNGYIYTASSMEYQNGTSYIYKLNAQTGEIIWEKTYSGIIYDKGVSGGVLSSPILGQAGTTLEGMVIYSVAKAPNAWSGILVALDTDTGEVIWEITLDNYTWSSPITMTTEDGTGYIVICDFSGVVRLIDGTNGEILDSVSLGLNLEASPSAFENKLVVGTRGQKVFGLQVG